jgi:hypothetical protein
MIFELRTLIDITETGARKGDDPREQLQQQNFHTALQTISLRANPTINKSPQSELISVKDLKFGSKYNGKHRVWTWRFSFEQADSHKIDFLISDFDLVPVITELDETVSFENAAFITLDTQYTNTIFSVIDDKY